MKLWPYCHNNLITTVNVHFMSTPDERSIAYGPTPHCVRTTLNGLLTGKHTSRVNDAPSDLISLRDTAQLNSQVCHLSCTSYKMFTFAD